MLQLMIHRDPAKHNMIIVHFCEEGLDDTVRKHPVTLKHGMKLMNQIKPQLLLVIRTTWQQWEDKAVSI